MKKLAFCLALFLTGLILSCGSSEDQDPGPGTTPPNQQGRCDNITSTLSNHVLSIINTNCAISGCHVSGAQAPDLSIRDNIISNAQAIRVQTESGNMPKSGSGLTLTPQEKDLIFCWVASGALNN